MPYHGPFALAGEKSMSTESTPALSVAVHSIVTGVPMSHVSPPAGESSVTLGAWTSTKFATSERSRSTRNTSGLVVVDVSPVQPVNAQPLAGVASSEAICV